MKSIGTNGTRVDMPKLAARAVFLVVFCNVLAFVVHCVNPVLMADDWYFLDVFVRKGIDGNLHFADFFVKRIASDHSEPFIKMVLLWCLRGFDLDISIEALVGVSVVLGCVLIFRFLIFSEGGNDAGQSRQLAWVTIAAILFSLNATEVWAWPLNSAQYSSYLPLPVFMWSVWRAYRDKKYLLLAVVTLILGFVSDDNAMIGVAATLTAIAFYVLARKPTEKGVLLRIVAVVLVCMLVMRIGYSHAPLVGGAPDTPLPDKLRALFDQVRHGEWYKWLITPLAWSIASRPFLPGIHDRAFEIIEYAFFGVMLFLHGWFWLRALRREWNLPIFVAVCLMLVAYGWIAGILVYRVSAFGADYFQQDRYVRQYQFELVALILMWVGSAMNSSPGAQKHRLVRWGTIACLGLVLLQIPISIAAWRVVPYKQLYFQNLARDIYRLAAHPDDARLLGNCSMQLSICGWPPEKRESLLRLLEDRRLNVFSPRVLLAHPYLLNATSSMSAASREPLLSAVQEAQDDASAENAYGSISRFLGVGRDIWPSSGIDVNALHANDVPLMLAGCWSPDGPKHHQSSWCGPDVSLILRRPADASRLIVQGSFPQNTYAQAGKSSPATLTVKVDDVPVATKTIEADGAFTIDIPTHDLPAPASHPDLTHINISSDSSFVPNRFSSSQDSRELSMKLSSVYFSTSTKDALERQ
ncbi:MAG: hypothetical protein QM741_01315 [Rudaea sp.]|uniref:hypothetical protein n=1 Tax=Rudaea sp. TaxID=2136325 RepID=UPI0039E53E99